MNKIYAVQALEEEVEGTEKKRLQKVALKPRHRRQQSHSHLDQILNEDKIQKKTKFE